MQKEMNKSEDEDEDDNGQAYMDDSSKMEDPKA